MKLPRSITLLVPLVALIYFSCGKTDSPPDNGYTPEYVTATVSGRVTNDAQMPISGALVKSGTASTITDNNGSFTMSNITIDKNAAYVKVEKEGYFLGTKTIVGNANTNNQVSIRLIKKTLAGTFTGQTGGTINVPSKGGSIAFETNSIVNPATNVPYTGSVAVSAFFINPEAADFRDIMPGTLRGINTSNEETGLQSFGMLAVELTGSAGEKLQLATGKKATLRFPIGTSLQSEAPATIPLWSLDETTGLWKEEGTATREGNEYVGTVSHFSFWNCDAPFAVVDFTATIKNQQGISIATAEVVITTPAGNGSTGTISGNGITNGEGIVNGKIPANKTLELKIYDKCRTLLHTQNIGPFSTSTDLGVITINSPTTHVNITGTAKNCSGVAITNGFVTILIDAMYYNAQVTNGHFEIDITRCNNTPVTATITAFDMATNQSGAAKAIAVSGSTVEAGELTACGTALDTYIKYYLNGVYYELNSITDTIFVAENNSSIFGFLGQRNKGKDEIVCLFNGNSSQQPGSYQLLYSDVYLNNKQYFKNGTFNVSISEFNIASGGYLAGTYSVIVKDSIENIDLPLTCSFRIRK